MTTTMDPGLVAGNRYLGKTRGGPGGMPRPTAADRKYAYRDGAELLRQDQQAWDHAEAWAAENDRLRDERLAKVEADRAAKQGEVAARQDDAFVSALRRTYLAADPLATEADFQRDLPEIRRLHRIAAATGATNVPTHGSSYSGL
jgi:ABC-type nitrate/sulfonate/bicarbonate transport system substrate-binding protein